MKRLVTLAVMVAFILGTVGLAKAVHQPADFQVGARGDWQISVNAVKNPTLNKDAKVDEFEAMQRLRTSFEWVVSENLMGVFRLHTENRWGQAGHQWGVSGRDTLGYDLAYIDFFIPQTDVNFRIGKQLHTLPGALGSPILDNFAYGVVASSPITDQAGITLGWIRPSDLRNRALTGGQLADAWATDLLGPAAPYAPEEAREEIIEEFLDDEDFDADARIASPNDELDVFFAVAPLTLDGIGINPYFAYGMKGSNFVQGMPNQQSSDVWWGGLNFNVGLFDPITVMGDVIYGSHSSNTSGIANVGAEARGWYAALAAEYAMDMFTPRLFAFYETGESSSSMRPDNRSKVMPQLSGDLHGISSFGFNGSNFRGIARLMMNNIQDGATGGATGKWGVGLHLRDITFIDQLSHTLQLVYYQGTNHRDGRNQGLFTTRDQAWEANFNTSYQMFENMAAILELGYMGVDLSEDTVERNDDDAWKAAAGIRFRF